MTEHAIQIQISREGGRSHTQAVEPGLYAVGADEENQIVLDGPGVAARHAILVLRSDGCAIEDLTNPPATLVDGQLIRGRATLRAGAAIRIGPFTLTLGPPAPVAPSAPPPAEPAPDPQRVPLPPPPVATSGLAATQRQAIKQQIHRELLDRLDLKRLTTSHIDEGDLHKRVQKTLSGIVKDAAPRLPPALDRDGLIKELYDEAVGLGPLEDLLADDAVTEIMVNGPNQVYVERRGRIELTDRTFLDDKSVLAIIERIVSPLGRRIDESQPYVDARLRDGSRVNAIIHPLSLSGPCLTIRKFARIPFTDEDMVRFGTLSPAMRDFLNACVAVSKNMIVSGGTGSGKTTFLNVLSSFLPDTDRIVTIEDAAELRLHQAHIVRLEARPPNIEGKGAVTIRDLVRNALRMRPDRIVVGECRGGEALDMLQAMNTGHDGSLTTIHANAPRDVISRLETMVLMSGMDLPVRAIREQIASAIDLIVHEARFSDGTRKITHIVEVVGLEGEKTTMQEIFVYRQTGVDPAGRVLGQHMATGAVPTFMDEIRAKGIPINPTIFEPSR